MSAAALCLPLDPETLRWAEVLMWVRELKRARVADYRTKRVAAERICELLGVAEALRAVWTDGFLRLPPAWPLVDAVPHGGGPGFIVFAVRSMIDGVRREVKITMRQGAPGSHADAIEEGVRRGKFELARFYR